jgi:hypothetical protein
MLPFKAVEAEVIMTVVDSEPESKFKLIENMRRKGSETNHYTCHLQSHHRPGANAGYSGRRCGGSSKF